MAAIIEGLTPLDAAELVQLSLAELRAMDLAQLVGLAHQLGVDVTKVAAERGKLLTEIMSYAIDA